MAKTATNRLQWFLDRISRMVYNPLSGRFRFIYDKEDAEYLHGMEKSHQQAGIPLTYFDTKEEAEQYKQTIK